MLLFVILGVSLVALSVLSLSTLVALMPAKQQSPWGPLSPAALHWYLCFLEPMS